MNTSDTHTKELIHMVHGHKQWYGNCLKEWGVLGGGGQVGKNWGNSNSTINKN